MATVVLDYGHGGKDPGATHRGRKEKDDVLKVGKKLKTKLEAQGIKVIETRNGDKFISLTERSNISNRNNPICFISLHRNAFNGKAYGVEIYTTSQSAAKGLAKKVQSNLVKLGFRDRGTKYKNFSVLYKTKAPAILAELGFIDNTRDNKIFDNNIDEIAQAILDAVMKEYNIKKKPNKPKSSTSNKDGFYRVVVGSYKDKSNAEKQQNKLKSKGFDSFLAYYDK